MPDFSDQKFLEFLVKSIVDHPDDEMGVLLMLKVNAQDMGQIIGRDGNTAKAMRALLRIVGIKNNARVNLKIEEPEGSLRKETHKITSAVDKVIDDIKDM